MRNDRDSRDPRVGWTCGTCVRRDTGECPADGHPAADDDSFFCAAYEGASDESDK